VLMVLTDSVGCAGSKLKVLASWGFYGAEMNWKEICVGYM
jgi:hypothetical protein